MAVMPEIHENTLENMVAHQGGSAWYFEALVLLLILQ